MKTEIHRHDTNSTIICNFTLTLSQIHLLLADWLHILLSAAFCKQTVWRRSTCQHFQYTPAADRPPPSMSTNWGRRTNRTRAHIKNIHTQDTNPSSTHSLFFFSSTSVFYDAWPHVGHHEHDDETPITAAPIQSALFRPPLCVCIPFGPTHHRAAERKHTFWTIKFEFSQIFWLGHTINTSTMLTVHNCNAWHTIGRCPHNKLYDTHATTHTKLSENSTQARSIVRIWFFSNFSGVWHGRQIWWLDFSVSSAVDTHNEIPSILRSRRSVPHK